MSALEGVHGGVIILLKKKKKINTRTRAQQYYPVVNERMREMREIRKKAPKYVYLGAFRATDQ